ncbi:hypothetical protein ACL02S_08420 [Nocardia sp. 004]|uniref:hypothetical protein n=1 Tax=Nocardia sp. 004 TaxID=3385978 RepID=UPI0039A3692D
MNPLLLIGGIALVGGLIGLITTVLLRPRAARAYLSVADLQARLARERTAVPLSPANENEPMADSEQPQGDGSGQAMPTIRQQPPPTPVDDKNTKEKAVDVPIQADSTAEPRADDTVPGEQRGHTE